MAYTSNQQFNEAPGVGSGLRCIPTSVQPKTFASGTGTLERLTALTFNTSTNKWQVFRGQVNEQSTITAHGTPATAGTFTLTVTNPVTLEQETTDGIPFNATAAQVQAALEALDNVAVGDVIAAATTGANLGAANAVVTLEWRGQFSGQNITVSINTSGLTGNPHVLAEAVQGGSNEDNGTNLIKGFVWPDPIVLDPSGEVLGQVVLGGRIHYDDIPLVAGVYDRVELELALRTQARELGYIIEGLSQFR